MLLKKVEEAKKSDKVKGQEIVEVKEVDESKKNSKTNSKEESKKI